jgi:hypothetical protein
MYVSVPIPSTEKAYTFSRTEKHRALSLTIRFLQILNINKHLSHKLVIIKIRCTNKKAD